MAAEAPSTLVRVDDFLVRLRAIPRKEKQRIWGLCMAEIKHLRTGRWRPATARPNDDDREGYEITTIRKVLTSYRNAIRDQLGATHPALAYLKPAQAIQREVKARDTKRIFTQHRSQRAISPEAMIAAAEQLISHPWDERKSPLGIAAGLLLLTGRRSIEILLTGEFKTPRKIDPDLFDRGVAAHDRQALIFSGQAKTRGAESAQTEPYQIPILTHAGAVLDAFAAVQSRYTANMEGFSTAKAQARYGKTIRELVARTFKDANGAELSPSDLRAAYAAIAFTRLAPRHFSLNAYVARVLGHSEGQFETSLSYCGKFYPIGEKRGFLTEIRDGTKAVIVQLERERDAVADERMKALLQERIDKFSVTLKTEKAAVRRSRDS